MDLTANLLIIVLLATCVILVVAGILIFMLMRSPQETGASGKCGNCGYNVQGLTEFQCPECGADLREVGIARPGKSMTPQILVALGVFVVLFAGCCGAGLLLTYNSTEMTPAVAAQVAPALPPVSPGEITWTWDLVEYNDGNHVISIKFNKSSIDALPIGDYELAEALTEMLKSSPKNWTTEEFADIELLIDGNPYRVGDYAEIEKNPLPDSDEIEAAESHLPS